jgi:hypothetical protein
MQSRILAKTNKNQNTLTARAADKNRDEVESSLFPIFP